MAVSRDTTTSWDATAGDVPFRAWVQAVEACLVGAGLVVVADSGDIDPATVTLPGVEGSAGYRIYRFDDAEQATNPIFIRVEFHRGDAATELRLHFIVGKGSDGAGTISNSTGGVVSSSAGSTDNASRLIHACLVDGELVVFTEADLSANQGFSLVVSRTRDRAGDFDGGIFSMAMYSNVAAHCALWNGGAWVATTPHLAVPQPAEAEGVYPLALVYPAGRPRPLRNFAWIVSTAVGGNESGEVTVEGEARDFISVNATGVTIVFAFVPSDNRAANVGAAAVWRALLRNE